VVAFEPILEVIANEARQMGYIIQHCPALIGRTRKESVDQHILHELQLLLSRGVEPHQVILASSDGDFMECLTYLKNYGHEVVTLHTGFALLLGRVADESYSLRNTTAARAAALHQALHRFVRENFDELREVIPERDRDPRGPTPAEHRIVRALIIAWSYCALEERVETVHDLPGHLHVWGKKQFLEEIEINFFVLVVSNIGVRAGVWPTSRDDEMSRMNSEHWFVRQIQEAWAPIEQEVRSSFPTQKAVQSGGEQPAVAQTEITTKSSVDPEPPAGLHNGDLAVWVFERLRERFAEVRGNKLRRQAAVVSWLLQEAPKPTPPRNEITTTLAQLVADGTLQIEGSGSHTYYSI